MRRLVLLTAFLIPMVLFGQTFDALWDDVEAAKEKDLPQTEIKALQKIVDKARKEKAYGQLLKAELQVARTRWMVSPDSLEYDVEHLQKTADAVSDVALQAVYYAVLGRVYEYNHQLSEDWKNIRQDYFRKAMAHPDKLAAVKATDYKPFVQRGTYSRIYEDDLLSLIGHETSQYQPMHDYYMTTNNRRAQLMSSLYLLAQDEPKEYEELETSSYIRCLDSLANAYAELPECGEVAVKRYEYMTRNTDATVDQRIAYIDKALAQWSAWRRMNQLRNARHELTALQFNTTLEHRVWMPNKPQWLTLHGLRGIDRLTVNIYKVEGEGDINLNPDYKDDYKKLKSRLTLMPELTLTRTYTGKRDYEMFDDDSLQLAGLPVGVYMMEVESHPSTQVSRTLFFISDVHLLMQSLPGNRIRYVVVSATTGQPLPGAKLQLKQHVGYEGNKPDYKVVAALTTDEKGEALYTAKNSQQRINLVFATTDNDHACPESDAYDNFVYRDYQRTTEQINIYTDRAIYRPGQTVHVAAICYEARKGFEHEVKAGKTLTVSLRDANFKIVAEKQIVTDSLGTVATEFTLPVSGLTGEFSVHVNNKSQTIRVEDYKRPTFQVEFPKMDQDYKAGDTLSVRATARTYSGVPVQGARVKYTVERRRAFWWLTYDRYWQAGYFGSGENTEELCSGETVTGDDGTFEVQMPMVMPRSQYPEFYNFVVMAEVTDLAGETHHGELSLPLGNRKTALTTDLSDKVLSEENPSMKLRVLNASGNDVAATVRYQIDGGKWMSVQSNTAVKLPKLKSGRHELKAEYEGQTLKREFVVFSLDDKRPAVETDDWFYVSATQFPNDGSPVTLQVGSSDDVHIFYTLVAGNDIIEQGATDKKSELINRKLTYKPEYGNGLTLSFAWVRNGKTYTHNAQIQRPLPDKRLKMRWETFRDRLHPGQQEEWTLKIEMPDRTPAVAQLMATLYDKSLDQIVEHNWSLVPFVWLPMSSLQWKYDRARQVSCGGYLCEPNLYVDRLDFSRFNKDCFPYPWLERHPRLLMRSMESKGLAMLEKEVVMEAKEVGAAPMAANSYDSIEESAEAENDEGTVPDVQIRENLQETAFFYPQLMADSTGVVGLKFTLPESLTTWRFMGIAHTRDMMSGYLDGETVAQKEVMIQPNVPRFIRVGDEVAISARVFNMTEDEQNGTAFLQFVDPETGESLWSSQQTAIVAAGSTAEVSFAVQASQFADYSLLICKMGFSSDNFSDGEQHYLPVLSNQERVTVTVPFTQNEPGTKTIDLNNLRGTGNHSTLTVEYTNNPAWFMIQALPIVGHPHDNCAICQASSYYANSIGRYILAQNPQAKDIFQIWKRETGSETSLMSSLQKNQELKDLVLDETPWVADANREQEQKERLVDFFDENLMSQRLGSSFENLKQLQRGDGSWSWWPGMDGSLYMTVEISEMLVRLNQMAGVQSDTKQMLDKAFGFMGKEMVKVVDEMKKEEKRGWKPVFPNHTALEWLYICTLDGRELPGGVQAANNYLIKLLKKETRNQSIYDKAMSAIVLNNRTYIQSLKEYTVYREEMGRYYDTQRAFYSWRNYRIPTQVAAIEAIQRLTPEDTQTIVEMQRWLLQEKRNQAWDTPVNSVDAVYAFLNGNSALLQTQEKTVLKVDGNEIETPKATAGIGYVKTAMPGDDKQTFTAEKTSTGTSWGAVYMQFMQQTNEIKEQNSGIKVKREILSAEANSSLKVGDRIKVRITIEADRDYDFVQVVDKRAACMEPVNQLSGYHWGYYTTPRDCSTNYYFDRLSKGKHVVETEYYIDRTGTYETGTCTASCAYSPEFRGTAKSLTIEVK